MANDDRDSVVLELLALIAKQSEMIAAIMDRLTVFNGMGHAACALLTTVNSPTITAGSSLAPRKRRPIVFLNL